LLIALVAARTDPRQRRVGLAVGGVLLIIFGAVWALVGGFCGIGAGLTLREATGWQVESLVGSVLGFVDFDSLRLEAGSWRIGRVSPTTSEGLLSLAASIGGWLAWRGGIHGRPLG